MRMGGSEGFLGRDRRHHCEYALARSSGSGYKRFMLPEDKSNASQADAGMARSDFRTTHWSVVLEAGGGSEAAHSALEKLCRSYWYPLYGFVRRRGHDEHQAQDLTQEFFARLLASDSLQSVSPEKGRFRTFLLAALKNFLASERRDATRQKRGGGKEFISYDEFSTEENHHVEPASRLEP